MDPEYRVRAVFEWPGYVRPPERGTCHKCERRVRVSETVCGRCEEISRAGSCTIGPGTASSIISRIHAIIGGGWNEPVAAKAECTAVVASLRRAVPGRGRGMTISATSYRRILRRVKNMRDHSFATTAVRGVYLALDEMDGVPAGQRGSRG